MFLPVVIPQEINNTHTPHTSNIESRSTWPQRMGHTSPPFPLPPKDSPVTSIAPTPSLKKGGLFRLKGGFYDESDAESWLRMTSSSESAYASYIGGKKGGQHGPAKKPKIMCVVASRRDNRGNSKELAIGKLGKACRKGGTGRGRKTCDTENAQDKIIAGFWRSLPNFASHWSVDALGGRHPAA